MRAALVAAALLVCGCKEPTYTNGYLRCADGEKPCPTGFHCAVDDTCWKDGEDPGAGDLGTTDGPATACAGADGTPCTGGLCHGGTCDTGSCFIGSVWYAPGARNPGNSCQWCDSATNRLSWTTTPDGGGCALGTCHGGTCCTGCWTGSACAAGTSITDCGKGGGGCQNCSTALGLGGAPGNCTNDPSCHSNMYMTYWVPATCTATGTCAYGAAQCCPTTCNGTGCL
jgi:hypothetical protein